MDTCNKISKYMNKVGYECRVMGVPKTIDNDLFGTDHCPGFASAAKYIATSAMEVGPRRPRLRHRHDHHHRVHGPSRRLADRRRRPRQREGAVRPTSSICPRSTSTWTSSSPTSPRATRRTATASSPSPRASTTPTAASSPRPRPPRPTASATPSWAAWLRCWPTSCKEKTGAKVRGIELSLLQRCARALRLPDRHRRVLHVRQDRCRRDAVNGVTDKMVGFECDRTNGYTCRDQAVQPERSSPTSRRRSRRSGSTPRATTSPKTSSTTRCRSSRARPSSRRKTACPASPA